MPISTNNSEGDKSIFFTPEYKTLVRSLKEVLLQSATSLPIPNPNDRFAYRNDFYRLLRSLGIKSHLWWTVAYLNGVENTNKDNSHIIEIRNVSEDLIVRAISRSNTRPG